MHQAQHLADEALLLLLAEAARDTAATSSQRTHLDTCSRCQMRQVQLTVLEARLRAAPADDDWASGARRVRRRAQLQQALRDVAAPPSLATLFGRAPLITGSLAAVVLAVVLFASGGGAIRFDGSRDRLTAPSDTTSVHTLPIRAITPGATVALAAEDLCRRMPWEPSPIPETVRDTILRAYGMEQVPDHEYELDYLITPDLGGSPDERNLWPEPYHSTVWNARVKDQLESLLPRLVCEGKVDLRTAQQDIAADWIAAYKKYFRTDRPLRQS